MIGWIVDDTGERSAYAYEPYQTSAFYFGTTVTAQRVFVAQPGARTYTFWLNFHHGEGPLAPRELALIATAHPFGTLNAVPVP